MIRVILICLLLTSCVSNPQLQAVIKDLESTPKCDNSKILISPKDTKGTLTARVIILNYKLNCNDNREFYLDQKLKKYKSL